MSVTAKRRKQFRISDCGFRIYKTAWSYELTKKWKTHDVKLKAESKQEKLKTESRKLKPENGKLKAEI